MSASAIIRAGVVVPCGASGGLGGRHVLTSDNWRAMAGALAREPGLGFVGLWGDADHVHALFDAGSGGRASGGGEPLLASAPVEAGLYAALSPGRAGAALFERAVADLWGHQAADAVDTRPWLDHGTWPLLRPLSDRPVPNVGAAEVPEMLVEEGVEAVPAGPLPPGLPGGWGAASPGPGHWRIGVEGGVVRRLEARLGYGHRGVLEAMRGKPVGEAARVVARVSGVATVAHSVAFARAVEAAWGVAAGLSVDVPGRARGLRAALLAVERVAMALHDGDGGARRQPARERVLAACGAAFGHRLLMDVVRPGGCAEAEEGGLRLLDEALAAAGPGAWAADVEVARAGLASLPEGAVMGEPAIGEGEGPGCEGLGQARGPQGRVWHWVRLRGGVVTGCFPIDPAWALLPAFEQAAVGVDVVALPGVAARMGLHLAGMEL